jgi:hypothetical protein
MAAGQYHASYLHGEVAEDPDAEGGVAEVAFPAQRALLEPARVSINRTRGSVPSISVVLIASSCDLWQFSSWGASP